MLERMIGVDLALVLVIFMALSRRRMTFIRFVDLIMRISWRSSNVSSYSG